MKVNTSNRVGCVALAALFCCTVLGRSLSVPLVSAHSYRDPALSVETRVDELLARMTLAEKIGQMLQITRTSAAADDQDPSPISEYFIGSVLSGARNSSPKPFANPSEWADMVDAYQKQALKTRLAIPLLYGIDAVHGHGSVYGATIFPHNVGLGCTRDPELVKRIGAVTALEVKATGIHYVFAPSIAVCRHPSWGRCYESFSEDPELVKNMTEIIVGLQGVPSRRGYPSSIAQDKVIASAKHYVGDGGTIGGIDKNDTISSYKRFVGVHMSPYVKAIAAGVNTIMVSHSSYNGVKMHSNHFLISHVLKKQLGFKGFVISDFRGIDILTTPADLNFSHSVNVAINAGIDMVMQPLSAKAFVDDLTAEVHSGRVSMRRINDAVRRILRVKFLSGIFEAPMANRSSYSVVGAKAHRQLAREAVRKSLVLLKNGKTQAQPMLPLDKKAARILVAGSHANDIGNQCGGWTISQSGSSGNLTKGTTVLSAVRKMVSHATEVVYMSTVQDISHVNGSFAYAIVVVGELPYAETVGDNKNLTIPEEGLETMKSVCQAIECVVIFMSGRPLVVEPYLPMMGALVAAWLPGTEGAGITDLIFGDYNFQGKLSRTWFKRVEQLPMNVGDKYYEPLFPYGFGLSMERGYT